MTVLDPFFRRSIRTSHPFRREGRRKAESVSTSALPDGPNTLLKLHGNPVPQNIASLTSLVSRRRRRQREKTQEMKLRRKSMQKREREERDWTPQRRAEIGSGHPSRQIGGGGGSCQRDRFENFLQMDFHTNYCVSFIPFAICKVGRFLKCLQYHQMTKF